MSKKKTQLVGGEKAEIDWQILLDFVASIQKWDKEYEGKKESIILTVLECAKLLGEGKAISYVGDVVGRYEGVSKTFYKISGPWLAWQALGEVQDPEGIQIDVEELQKGAALARSLEEPVSIESESFEVPTAETAPPEEAPTEEKRPERH